MRQQGNDDFIDGVVRALEPKFQSVKDDLTKVIDHRLAPVRNDLTEIRSLIRSINAKLGLPDPDAKP